ncbi:MAG: putative glutamine amidotransferase [Nitrospirae bacterium]|jgi:putative glutamine amidotransferase|nr:putative glutamine amidotransferase [Nitrospirota bacterium]MBS1192143.1 putative glutamine amidotransferase [Nitrospirota bacterium]
MKPLIGITMNLEERAARYLNILDQDYGKAVLQAGGIPVPVLGIKQSIPDIMRQLDGFLFTGGDDIHPRLYHERPLAGAKLMLTTDNRVKFEIDLFKAAVKARKPVLAVCYGAQLVNVALGGKLYQDIALQVPKAIRHGAAKAGEKVFHRVSIFEGTRLCRIMGNYATGDCSIRVRSAHHQSIKNPGKGLRLSAVSPDGVFEALESRGKNYLVAVQWHPEKTLTDGPSQLLFESLIHASRR